MTYFSALLLFSCYQLENCLDGRGEQRVTYFEVLMTLTIVFPFGSLIYSILCFGLGICIWIYTKIPLLHLSSHDITLHQNYRTTIIVGHRFIAYTVSLRVSVITVCPFLSQSPYVLFYYCLWIFFEGTLNLPWLFLSRVGGISQTSCGVKIWLAVLCISFCIIHPVFFFFCVSGWVCTLLRY